MVDFNNSIIRIAKTRDYSHAATIGPLMADGEEIVSEYSGFRDAVVFTNKRIIVIKVQGMAMKKKEFTSIPYSKIQTFSIETEGVLDFDSELDIFLPGLGKLRFEFNGECDITTIGRMISELVL